MKATYYQQCVRCVMDTTDREIAFDKEGRCNHCTDYFQRLAGLTYHGKASDEELERIVGVIRAAGRSSDYDCLVGISGGIDSTYAAYTLKNLGLRTLCVHMDNGWDSEISVRNIKHVVSKLALDYQSHVLDWDRFKDLQVSFLRASVPEAETPTDNAIQGVVYGAAKKHNIKYVISGGNFATEGIFPKSWHYDAKDAKYLRAIHTRFGTTDLQGFPIFSPWDWIYYKLMGINTIYLLNYVPYSKKLALEVLEGELAWRYYGGKHYESRYTGFIQSYLLFQKFKIDYRRPTLSTQICAGEVSREDALGELAFKPYDPIKIEQEVQYFCKKLGISLSEFREIVAAPPKTYEDYPNQKAFLELLYGTYRWFSPLKH